MDLLWCTYHEGCSGLVAEQFTNKGDAVAFFVFLSVNSVSSLSLLRWKGKYRVIGAYTDLNQDIGRTTRRRGVIKLEGYAHLKPSCFLVPPEEVKDVLSSMIRGLHSAGFNYLDKTGFVRESEPPSFPTNVSRALIVRNKVDATDMPVELVFCSVVASEHLSERGALSIFAMYTCFFSGRPPGEMPEVAREIVEKIASAGHYMRDGILMDISRVANYFYMARCSGNIDCLGEVAKLVELIKTVPRVNSLTNVLRADDSRTKVDASTIRDCRGFMWD
jgi:hypothetical protein